MERLTSEANARSQSVDRVQGLEVQLEKLTYQKASVEAREKKVKEDASLVGSLFRLNPVFLLFFVTITSVNVFAIPASRTTTKRSSGLAV